MFTLWVHFTKAYITKMLNEQIIMFLARIKHLIFPRPIQHRTKLSETCNVPDSFLMSNALDLKHMPMPCSEVFVPFKRLMWYSSDWHIQYWAYNEVSWRAWQLIIVPWGTLGQRIGNVALHQTSSSYHVLPHSHTRRLWRELSAVLLAGIITLLWLTIITFVDFDSSSVTGHAVCGTQWISWILTDVIVIQCFRSILKRELYWTV